MLTRLRVHNLALVDDITLEFGPGFNVITGETGAGKSVLIGALNLLSGKRADRSAIRDESRQAVAEAEFFLVDPDLVNDYLEELGLPPLEEGQLILRRILKSAGGSSALVNDQSVTLSALREIGTRLLDLHGPHDHQSLFHASVQRDILDDFGRHRKERTDYESVYQDLRSLEEDIERLTAADEDASRLDLLSYRVQELEDAALSEEEEETIEQEHEQAGHAVEIMELGSACVRLIQEDDPSASDLFHQILHNTQALSRLLPDAEAWHEELTQLADRLQSLGRDMEQSLSSMEASPERMAELDQRLSTYRNLKRKYRRSVRELTEWLEESREELDDLQHREERLADLETRRDEILSKVQQAGKKLRRKRNEAGERLAEAMTAEIQALGFKDGQFDVRLKPTEPSAQGLDAVDFGFAPNVGEPMRALKQIASSGEMSRVLLAVKSVLARHDRVPVLVFDEIDANVGGEIGSAVGRKLREVAEHHQVLCITHLPQVAVFGNRHYAIAKHVRNQRTLTEAAFLEGDGRVREVARMLGGESMSSVTLDHARQMIDGIS